MNDLKALAEAVRTKIEIPIRVDVFDGEYEFGMALSIR
jgi:hypothetical protein